MSNRQFQQFNIGYNKSNDDYLNYLEEKNRILKDQQRTKEYQEKQKKEEREKGFNVYISGANQGRVDEQRRKEILQDKRRAESNQDSNSKGARRQWRNPSVKDEYDPPSESKSHVKYHNPFDLKQDSKYKEKSTHQSFAEGNTQKGRKKWGDAKSVPTHGKKDEDDYSDSFEEDPYQDYGEEKEEEEERNKDAAGNVNEFEYFLKTCTKNDLETLKQSLSCWGDFKKENLAKPKEEEKEEEYIEENFEEDIPEDNEESSEDERKQYEALKQKQIEQAKNIQQNSKIINKQGKIRPISATHNLAIQRVGAQSTKNDSALKFGGGQFQEFRQQETQKYSGGGGLNSVQSQALFQGSMVSQGPLTIQETPMQPKDNMKKPINTNPFKRPFSHAVPKRMAPSSQNKFQTEEVREHNKTSEAAFSSQNQNLENILQRISGLEAWQKDTLLEVLNQLEQSSANVSLGTQSQGPSQKSLFDNKKIDLNFLSPAKSEYKAPQVKKTLDINRNELCIRVLNTYGNPHICGLTEIEIFDEKGAKIPIIPANLAVRNLGQGPKMSLEKLINGVKLTNDEKQMWIGYLPMYPKHLELLVYFNKELKLGGIKIWNYNKNIIDSTKGMRDVQILINDDQVWEGEIKSGKGQIDIEYGTSIIFKEGVVLPQAIQPKPAVVDEAQEEEEEESKDFMSQSQANSQIQGKANEKQQEEEFKKYRSELNLKQKQQQQTPHSDSTPLWLQDNKNQKPFQPFSVKKSDQGSSQGLNTFDILDKYSKEGSTLLPDHSSQTSRASNQPSNQQSQRQQPSIQSKPSVGSYATSRQYESQIQKDSKPWSQPFSIQQRNETHQAVKDAVSKVNQVVGHNEYGSMFNLPNQKAGRRQNKLIEESLDSLDFFKVTNLGRLQNENDKHDEKKSSRAKWGNQSPGKQAHDSIVSSGKKNAHVVVKSPFPMDQPRGQESRKQMNFPKDDYLEQMINPKKDPVANFISKQQDELVSKNKPLKAFDIPRDPLVQYQKPIEPEPVQKQLDKPKKYLSYEEKLHSFSQPFIIPNLPQGTVLSFNILSTWGDMNYVGLTGIEIFDIEGNQVQIPPYNISAIPPDINILANYGSDPRTIDKLIDGHYYTNDDLHVWLAPFTPGDDHSIEITLEKKIQVSMIRIWNYNKSRIHSYRGARLITCDLDGKTIFKGEIQKAPGNLNDPSQCCEIILFTDNDAVLNRIDEKDWLNDSNIVSDLENTQRIMQEVPSFVEERPMTATKKFSTAELEDIQRQMRLQKPTHLFDDRPMTSAIISGDQPREESKQSERKPQQLQKESDYNRQPSNLASAGSRRGKESIKGKLIEFNILESWGDLFYVGLNGLEILDENGYPINISMSMVDAEPRDMNSIPGHGSDHRTLDKLFDRTNNTADDHHMWLIPFNKGENHYIRINFGRVQNISGIRIYNYNKSPEDSLRGAKQIVIKVDEKLVTPKKGVTVRKAPGLVHSMFDMGQTIKIPFKQGWTTEQIVPIQRKFGDVGVFQEYEPINMPMGFLFRFNLYSTHGDFYYIGLNGIEMFDQQGNLIKADKIVAQPPGVYTLSGMQDDNRTIDKLLNGQNQTFDDQNMWLSPFKNTRSMSAANGNQDMVGELRMPNYIYIYFDEVKVISAVKIWNYSKTPARGVNEIEMLVDDKNVFRGFVKQAPEKKEWDKAFKKDFSTTILFTSDNSIVERFRGGVNYDPMKQQSVQMVNERKLMNRDQVKQRPNEEYVFNEQARPATMVKKKAY